MGAVDSGVCCFFLEGGGGAQVDSDSFLERKWPMKGSLEKLGGGNETEFFWEERGLGRLACV